MPILSWIGKDAVINHHLEVPFKTLEKKYTEGGENSENKIIHGDNLEALKALLPEYEGRVKCVYIDPPYNTGNENWVYNDNVNSPRIRKWLGETVGKEMEDLTRHDKWLCMMYPRLKLLHQLLADDGVIFISIDDNEQANLKLICDEIFGQNNFIGIWCWYRSATPPNLSYKIKKNIEYVLCYEKHKTNYKFVGLQKVSNSDDPLIKPQNTIKTLTFPPLSIKCKISDKIVPAGTYGTKKYPNILLNDMVVKNGYNENAVSFSNRFIWKQEKLDEQLSRATVINCSRSIVLSYKKQEYDPEVPPSLIDDAVGVQTTEEAGKTLSNIFGKDTIFEYPKDVTLIEYLISFIPDSNALILDSFAGSGTTAHAVLNLNKKDGGNRKFILVEMEDYAESITSERVRRVMKGYGKSNKAVEGTGGDFSFYELGEAIMVNGNLNDKLDVETIREFVWYSETHTPYTKQKYDHPYLLGRHDDTDYYFYYEPDKETTLDRDFLATITQKAERYLIYADNCLLPQDDMAKYNIVFKKIPRDIKTF